MGEFEFELGTAISDIKEHVLPSLAPGGYIGQTKVMLMLDGGEPGNEQTLLELGAAAGEVVDFTALIYDPQILARQELNAMHRDAIERSRQESSAARQERRLLREALILERKREVEAEYAASRERWQGGPMLMLSDQPDTPLMLAAEPANAAASGPEARKPSAPAVAQPKDLNVEVHGVVAAYKGFFQHISYRKGWKEPPFAEADALDAFTTAARIVARARIEVLDKRDEGFKIRQVEGSACDWMHSPETGQLLRERPDVFIAELVHATFKDAHGYVESMNQREVDDFIKRFS